MKKILIVDDFKIFGDSLVELIKDYGLGFAQSETSTTRALELLGAEHFDMVLCDIDLGVRNMTGFEFLAVMRAEHPKTRIVLMTGNEDHQEELDKMKPDDYFIKDLPPDELRAFISRNLALSP